MLRGVGSSILICSHFCSSFTHLLASVSFSSSRNSISLQTCKVNHIQVLLQIDDAFGKKEMSVIKFFIRFWFVLYSLNSFLTNVQNVNETNLNNFLLQIYTLVHERIWKGEFNITEKVKEIDCCLLTWLFTIFYISFHLNTYIKMSPTYYLVKCFSNPLMPGK